MSKLQSISSRKTLSVLSDNQSHLERALELALCNCLYSVEHKYPELLDPNKTSIEIVPYLAIEKQLAIWDSKNSDAIKRTATAQAWPVRRKSGTRQGLVECLESLGFNCEVIPWFKQTPNGAPYSFNLWAYCNDQKITKNLNSQLDQLLIETKSERDNYSLFIARGSINNNFIGISSEMGIEFTSEPYVPKGFDSEASFFSGSAIHSREIITSEPAIQ